MALIGEWTTEDLWKVFGEYEDMVRTTRNGELAVAYATMAGAIAKIIANRANNTW